MTANIANHEQSCSLLPNTITEQLDHNQFCLKQIHGSLLDTSRCTLDEIRPGIEFLGDRIRTAELMLPDTQTSLFDLQFDCFKEIKSRAAINLPTAPHLEDLVESEANRLSVIFSAVNEGYASYGLKFNPDFLYRQQALLRNRVFVSTPVIIPHDFESIGPFGTRPNCSEGPWIFNAINPVSIEGLYTRFGFYRRPAAPDKGSERWAIFPVITIDRRCWNPMLKLCEKSIPQHDENQALVTKIFADIITVTTASNHDWLHSAVYGMFPLESRTSFQPANAPIYQTNLAKLLNDTLVNKPIIRYAVPVTLLEQFSLVSQRIGSKLILESNFENQKKKFCEHAVDFCLNLCELREKLSSVISLQQSKQAIALLAYVYFQAFHLLVAQNDPITREPTKSGQSLNEALEDTVTFFWNKRSWEVGFFLRSTCANNSWTNLHLSSQLDDHEFFNAIRNDSAWSYALPPYLKTMIFHAMDHEQTPNIFSGTGHNALRLQLNFSESGIPGWVHEIPEFELMKICSEFYKKALSYL
jgi:hypothetical protein